MSFSDQYICVPCVHVYVCLNVIYMLWCSYLYVDVITVQAVTTYFLQDNNNCIYLLENNSTTVDRAFVFLQEITNIFSFLLIKQVSLKSPDVLLTLPIHIGNVSLDSKLHPSKKAAHSSSAAAEDTPASAPTSDTSTSAAAPAPTSCPAPKPAPRPTPRPRMSSHISPSAPPAEYHGGAEGGTPMNDGFVNKRQSQLVSPNAFSYAPGLFFPQNQQPNTSGTVPTGSTGITAPYCPGNSASSAPAPFILPPDYGTSAYPQGQWAHTHSVKSPVMTVEWMDVRRKKDIIELWFWSMFKTYYQTPLQSRL